jgi:CDP-glucose 4,6-dehydratase
MKKLTNFYKNKKILVTGATGFKGSWLCFWLLKLGAKVYGTGFRKYKSKNLFFDLELRKKVHIKFFDIRDFKKVNKFIDDTKPEIIFHLAAQPLVSNSYEYPMYTFDVNLMGTLNVLEASKNCKNVKSIICVTTDRVYEHDNKNRKFKETDKLGGIDPYSLSKASAELIIKSYKEIFKKIKKKCGISSVRAANIVGGGDWSYNRLIPDTIKSFTSNKILIVRNPNFTRQWQFILEPLRGYLILAKKQYGKLNEFSSNWNFGPNSEISVIEILKLIMRFWKKGKYKIIKNKKFAEQKNTLLDMNKTRKYLKWKAIYNTKKSIQITIKWYFDVIKNKKKPIEVTSDQINSYMKSANLK